jgi:hypothetical protein
MKHNVDNAGTTLDRQLAYAILRLTLGVNTLVHGLVHLPQLASFADGLLQAFAKTPLPPQAVRLFAFILPICGDAGWFAANTCFVDGPCLGGRRIVRPFLHRSLAPEKLHERNEIKKRIAL